LGETPFRISPLSTHTPNRRTEDALPSSKLMLPNDQMGPRVSRKGLITVFLCACQMTVSSLPRPVDRNNISYVFSIADMAQDPWELGLRLMMLWVIVVQDEGVGQEEQWEGPLLFGMPDLLLLPPAARPPAPREGAGAEGKVDGEGLAHELSAIHAIDGSLRLLPVLVLDERVAL
jgi:hypothetical protein